MNSGNSCKNSCVRVRVCVRAAERLVCSRRRLGRGETRGKLETLPTSQWVCAAVRPRSRAPGWRGSPCGDTEHGHVRELLWQEAAPGSMPAPRPCRGDTTDTESRAELCPRALAGGWGSCWTGNVFPKDLPFFLLLVAFPAALGSVCPQVLPFLPRALLPLAAPGPCLGRCRGLSPLYHAGYSCSRWKFLLFLFPGNLSGFKGCTVDDASAVTTATSRLQLRRELRGIFQLCSEAFSSSALK